MITRFGMGSARRTGSTLLAVLALALGIVATTASAAPVTQVTAPSIPRAASPTADPRGTLRTVTPTIVLDTRKHVGIGTTTPVGPNSTTPIKVTGGAVPTSAVAVVVTLTVTGGSAAGYLTAYASGTTRPGVTSLAWARGETRTNTAVVKVGADGRINLWSYTPGTTHLIASVTGYYLSDGATAGVTTFVTPTRLIDTRSRGPVAGQVVLRPTGVGGVPATGVSAVLLNLLALQGTASGYLGVYSSDAAAANIERIGSNLNWARGASVANAIWAPVGPDGTIVVSISTGGNVQLVADVSAWVGSGPLSAAGTVHATLADRLVDTRTSPPPAPIPANGSMTFEPFRDNPSEATNIAALVVNLTVTNGRSTGYLTAHAAGTSRPAPSTTNWSPATSVANLTVVPVNAAGSFTVTSVSPGTVDLIVDVVGTVLRTPIAQATGWAVNSFPVPSAVPPGSDFYTRGAVCTGAHVCVAGASTISDGRTGQDILGRFDGTTWTTQAVPSTRVGALACGGPALCVSVSNTWGSVTTGGAWASQPLPDPGAQYLATLAATCPTSQRCFGVGYAMMGADTRVNHPHGTGWMSTYVDGRWQRTLAAPVLPAGTESAAFSGVSCRSATSCLAVGYTTSPGTTYGPLAYTWDGVEWSPTPLPTLPTGSSLRAVKCSTETCTVNGSTGSDGLVLSQSADGTWTSLATPHPSYPGSPACVAAQCVFVGADGRGTVRFYSSTTSDLTEFFPRIASGSTPVGLFAYATCAQDSTCLAVGTGLSGATSRGWVSSTGPVSAWMIAAAPMPADAIEWDLPFNSYFSSSCSDATLCLALSDYISADGHRRLFALTRRS